MGTELGWDDQDDAHELRWVVRHGVPGTRKRTTGAFSGTWSISHGTGAIAGIHGAGTWFEDDLSQPGIVVFLCEGEIHFD